MRKALVATLRLTIYPTPTALPKALAVFPSLPVLPMLKGSFRWLFSKAALPSLCEQGFA